MICYLYVISVFSSFYSFVQRCHIVTSLLMTAKVIFFSVNYPYNKKNAYFCRVKHKTHT